VPFLASFDNKDVTRKTISILGNVVANTSFFRQQDFSKSLASMKKSFRSGICVSVSGTIDF